MAVRKIADDQIRTRADQIYLEHRRQPGRDLDDWAQAEYELMQLPVRQIADLQPPQRQQGNRTSLVALVQAAVLLGVGALSRLNR